MKHTAGYAKPRRMTALPGQARLNLQRRPKPEPEDDLDERQRSQFWKWVLFVALLHVLAILGCCVYYLFAPANKPPDQFITLLPLGDTVKGTPGKQEAHKLGANTPAAPSHHAAPPPPTASHPAPSHPKPATPTPPTPVKPTPPPKPIVKENAPSPTAAKPVKTEKPQPVKAKTEPVKQKVKVDLHEVDRSDATDTPPKPAKHHSKKPVKNPDDSPDDADSSPDNTGLSKQQIAEKLGEKMNASGSHNATKYGASGAHDGHENNFQDFYAMIANQVSDTWNNASSSASVQTEPIVHMHVEPNGHVVPESVYLIRSSGDTAYDEAAIATVKRLGYLREPLPAGCPPDIRININPNPTQ